MAATQEIQGRHGERLRALVPISRLPPDLQNELLEQARVIAFSRGQFIFREGDRDEFTFYLLDGEVELSSGGQQVKQLSGNSPDARQALAQLQPRQLSARAVTHAHVLRIDRTLLEQLLARADSPELSEPVDLTEVDPGDDWMIRLLQSPLFARIPPSNIQGIFTQGEHFSARAGQVIVEQGAPGDYYYVLKEGRAEVLRRGGSGSEPTRLAEIGPGDPFGEEALVGRAKRNATVSMLTDGQLMRLTREDFVRFIQEPLLREVSLSEAQAMVADGALWMDVRFAEEYRAGAVPGSVNLPLNLLRSHVARLDRGRTYVVYCESGIRSSVAAFLLTERGFDAFYLIGGIAALRVVPVPPAALAPVPGSSAAPPAATSPPTGASPAPPAVASAAPVSPSAVPAAASAAPAPTPAPAAASPPSGSSPASPATAGAAAGHSHAHPATAGAAPASSTPVPAGASPPPSPAASEERAGEAKKTAAKGSAQVEEALQLKARAEQAMREVEEARRTLAEQREKLEAEARRTLAEQREKLEAEARRTLAEQREKLEAEARRTLAEQREKLEAEARRALEAKEEARRLKEQVEAERKSHEQNAARTESELRRAHEQIQTRERALREAESRRQREEEQHRAHMERERQAVEAEARRAAELLQEARQVKDEADQAKRAAEAEVARRREEEEARLAALREETEAKLRDRQARLEAAYTWKFEELARLQRSSQHAEDRSGAGPGQEPTEQAATSRRLPEVREVHDGLEPGRAEARWLEQEQSGPEREPTQVLRAGLGDEQAAPRPAEEDLETEALRLEEDLAEARRRAREAEAVREAATAERERLRELKVRALQGPGASAEELDLLRAGLEVVEADLEQAERDLRTARDAERATKEALRIHAERLGRRRDRRAEPRALAEREVAEWTEAAPELTLTEGRAVCEEEGQAEPLAQAAGGSRRLRRRAQDARRLAVKGDSASGS